MSTTPNADRQTLKEWVDAHPEVEITVMAKDIAEGVRQDCMRCPIALAIARVTPFKDAPIHVMTSEAFIYVPLRKNRQCQFARYKLPVEAYAFISAFDTGATLYPFTFTMWVVDTSGL